MTNTQQFIEDAFEGGLYKYEFRQHIPVEIVTEKILLMPSAWQAVGKTRGWKQKCYICKGEMNGSGHLNICSRVGFDEKIDHDTPRHYIHRFLDLLIDGKTIEEALSEIK